MKKLIASTVIGLITLDILLSLSTPIQAQEVQETAECAATVADMRKTIKKGRDVLVSTSNYNASKQYLNYNYPVNRLNGYIFNLKGSANDTIANSPEFLKIIATRIINSCNSVSLITFKFNYTVYKKMSLSISLMPNGKIDFSGFNLLWPMRAEVEVEPK